MLDAHMVSEFVLTAAGNFREPPSLAVIRESSSLASLPA